MKVKIPEIFFVIISLLFFTKGLQAIFPNFIITILRYGILLISSVVLISLFKHTLYIVSRSWLISVVLMLETISFLWSDFPEFTLLGIRSEMIPMSIFGLYLATRFTLRKQIELLGYALTLAMLLSFIVALVSPSIGIGSEGLFRGIYAQKNVASGYGVLAALSFFSLTFSEEKKCKFKAWIVFSLAITFVLATTSKTGLVLSFLIPSAMYFYSKLYLRGKFAVVLSSLTILILGITSVLVIDNWVSLLNNIGGDPSLSGRTPMWTFILDKISERPWLGYGRTAFWAPQTNHSIEVAKTVTVIDYKIFHAHNGFLDLLLDIGLIGGLTFLVNFSIIYMISLRRACLAVQPEDIWPLGFLLFLIMNNATESFLTWNLNLFWVLYVSLSFSINKRSSKANVVQAIEST